MQNKNKAARAQIFQPFDSLKGFREYLKEMEKIVVTRKELSTDQYEDINFILHQLTCGKMVKLIHYHNQQYIETKGMVVRIDELQKRIKIVDKWIFFYDIVSIEIVENDVKK